MDAGQSPENLAVIRNIVQLSEAISANKDVFNKIMLGSVEQDLISLSFMNDLATSETSLSTKAIQFINSIQAVLKHGPCYLDKFLTVLVENGDPCCKQIATKIINNYNDRLLPNYKQAITINGKAKNSNTSFDKGDDIDTRSFFQLLNEADYILTAILKRTKKCIKFVLWKFHKCFFFFLILLFVLLVVLLRIISNIYYNIFYLCVFLVLCNKNRLANVLVYGLIFSFGLNLMDVKMQNDMQITTDSSITRTVIGGQPDSINWLEGGFKMDIFPSSFPLGIPVNITISLHQSNPLQFLVTQIYTITSSFPSSETVLVHLTHNLVFDNIPMLILIEQHDTNEKKMHFVDDLSKYYITSQIQIKTKFYISGVRIPTHGNAYRRMYYMSIYAKEGLDYMTVAVVIKFPGDKSIDSKYSSWMKDSRSPYKFSTFIKDVDLTIVPSGCWDKIESEEYTQIILNQQITKGEYFFKLQWKCLWWPHLSYIELTNNQSGSGINAYIYTNASSTFIAFAHSIVLLANNQVVVSILKVLYTVGMVSIIIRYMYFHISLINIIIYNTLILLNTWFIEILEITEYFMFQVQWPIVLFDALFCIYLFLMVAS